MALLLRVIPLAVLAMYKFPQHPHDLSFIPNNYSYLHYHFCFLQMVDKRPLEPETTQLLEELHPFPPPLSEMGIYSHRSCLSSAPPLSFVLEKQ
jgi:hypothetical protein